MDLPPNYTQADLDVLEKWKKSKAVEKYKNKPAELNESLKYIASDIAVRRHIIFARDNKIYKKNN